MAKKFHTFDGMCWPLPGDEPDGDGLEWRLRYASGRLSDRDRLHAASIVNAYRELIRTTVMQRNRVLRELRTAVGKSESKV